MATATSKTKKVARNAPPRTSSARERIILGLDCGNHNVAAARVVQDSLVTSSCMSWFQEVMGTCDNLGAVSDMHGSTIQYLSGCSEYIGRIIKVGQSAINQSLVGDQSTYKLDFYLPFLLHSIHQANPDLEEVEVVVVMSLDDMTDASRLKDLCSGVHRWTLLDTAAVGGDLIYREKVTIIQPYVIQEGFGSLWYLALDPNSGVSISDTVLVVDGGGGTFDALVVQGDKNHATGQTSARKLASNSVTLGGNDIINAVLRVGALRRKFQSIGVDVTFSLIAQGIKDGTMVYVSGDGKNRINYSDYVLTAIQELLPRWETVIRRTAANFGGQIRTVIPTGGLMKLRYLGDVDADDSGVQAAWSLQDLLLERFSYEILERDDQEYLNAKGNAAIAREQSKNFPDPLPL